MDNSTSSHDPFANDDMNGSSSHVETSIPSRLDSSNQLGIGAESQPASTQEPSYEARGPSTASHSPARHRQQQSHYYITFSVTGIERSNAKNPIIRFDAKVSLFRSQ
jgi:hypothetical protein